MRDRLGLLEFRLTPAKIIILCCIFLNVISLTTLYSALHQGGEFTQHPIFNKQIIWIIICWLSLIVFSLINYRLYFNFAYILYAINLILLVAVELFGKTVMGAQRWLSISGFSFQPSEVSKIVILIVLAKSFSSGRGKGFLRQFVAPFCLTMINAALIFKQPDLGTALIIIFIFFIMGLSSGVKKRFFVFAIIAGIIAAPFAWAILKEYQKKRLVVFLNPNVDPLGAGYTIIQSKIAIGSGRVFGKGFLSGTQNQFNFLPERHTDFIFTVIAEEWGFIGSVFLLIIYWLILAKMLDIIRTLKDPCAQLLSLGVCALLFLHIFINMGMTLGVLPVVGVPLLFISYGGTHLLTTFILLGIFFNIYRQQLYK
ncbi:MAG: rod shape-determining protein RodA [Candidatus Omnitrophica bacterium]|nr:rod shape-determining protein RodA [Candidatus Omnitrophota bacterium]